MEELVDAAGWPVAATSIGFILGFVSKAVTDVLTDRRRSAHEHRMRVLDQELRQSVESLVAADRLQRSRKSTARLR